MNYYYLIPLSGMLFFCHSVLVWFGQDSTTPHTYPSSSNESFTTLKTLEEYVPVAKSTAPSTRLRKGRRQSSNYQDAAHLLQQQQQRRRRHQLSRQGETNDETDFSTTKKTKLGDGCYHVFLDVGSGSGMHGKFLMEPEPYPNAKSAITFLQQQFSNKAYHHNKQEDDSNRGQEEEEEEEEENSHNQNPFQHYSLDDIRRNVCVFAIEPNPLHRQKQLELQDTYRQMGWQYTYLAVGVGNQDQANLVYYPKSEDEDSPPVRSKLSSWLSSGKDPNEHGDMTRTVSSAPVIRFATWLQNEILDRKVPNYNFMNPSHDDPTYDGALYDPGVHTLYQQPTNPSPSHNATTRPNLVI